MLPFAKIFVCGWNDGRYYWPITLMAVFLVLFTLSSPGSPPLESL